MKRHLLLFPEAAAGTLPAVPAAEKPPTEKKIEELTPEELEAERSNFLARSFSDVGPEHRKPAEKEKKPTPDETAKAEADKKAKEEADRVAKEKADADAKAKEEADRKAAPAKEAKKHSIVTAEEVKSIKLPGDEPFEAPKPPLIKAPDGVTLSAKDTLRIETLQRMEQEGNAPKGTADKTLKFWADEAAYIETWKKANPGQEFERDSEDHAKFYDSEPAVDADIFESTEDSVREARIEERLEKKNEGKLERLKFEQDFDKAKPVIAVRAHNSVIDLIAKAVPDFVELMKGKDGKVLLDTDIADKLEEKDPVAFAILDQEAEELRILVTELERISRFGQHYKLNPHESIKIKATGRQMFPHRELVRYSEEIESEFAAMPAEESVRKIDDKTKKFITHTDYRDRVQKITEAVQSQKLSREQGEAAMRDLDAKTWSITPEDIRVGLVADRANNAQERIKQLDGAANRKYRKSAPAAGETPPTEAEKEEAEKKKKEAAEKQEKNRRERPPSSATASDRSEGGRGGAVSGVLTESQIEKRMWGS